MQSVIKNAGMRKANNGEKKLQAKQVLNLSAGHTLVIGKNTFFLQHLNVKPIFLVNCNKKTFHGNLNEIKYF